MKKNNISIISAFLFFLCIDYNNDAITEKKNQYSFRKI